MLAPVFPSISTTACIVIVPFLWLVRHRAFPVPPHHTGGIRQVLEPFLPPPARHTGCTRQVFDGWLLPCCRVCVSFNCFSSRVPGSIDSQTAWEWVLRSRIFDSSYGLVVRRNKRSSPESPIFLRMRLSRGGLVLRYGLERPVNF